jgi:glycosyltransferase involved in cell wall biosynthesis
MAKIDVIIPAYNAEETLGKALGSVYIQSVSNDIKVTIVDDCGADASYPFGYKKAFEGLLDIEVIRLPKNSGPAVARQVGMDATKGDYICFLDADDTFAGSFALEMLRNKLDEDETVVLVSGLFFEKRKEMAFVKHENDMTWLHGKMYRRSFIDKYGICFNETRANEDVGFNTKIKLLENEKERIAFLPNLVYYWQWNDGGITRINDFAYTYDASYFGYVENQIDAITFAMQNGKVDDFLLGYTFEVLSFIYIYLLRIRWKRPELEPKAWEYARRYYNEVMALLDFSSVTDEQRDLWITVGIATQISHLHGRIIDMTFDKFMEILLA